MHARTDLTSVKSPCARGCASAQQSTAFKRQPFGLFLSVADLVNVQVPEVQALGVAAQDAVQNVPALLCQLAAVVGQRCLAQHLLHGSDSARFRLVGVSSFCQIDA